MLLNGVAAGLLSAVAALGALIAGFVVGHAHSVRTQG